MILLDSDKNVRFTDGFVRIDLEIMTLSQCFTVKRYDFIAKISDIQNVRKGPDQVKDKNAHLKKLLQIDYLNRYI